MRKNIFLSAIIVLMISACNKTTTELPGEGKSGQLTDKVGVLFYPHEKDFFKLHGQNYLENKGQCLSCHGPDGTGGNTKVSCKTCHASFPHPREWAVPKNHAASYTKDSQSCLSCHGADGTGGKSKVSCYSCHANFPHPKGWAVPTQHGKAFVAMVDKSECLGCHNLENANSVATNCTICHKAFPHKAGFTMGGADHAELARSYAGKCLACHRDYKENMPKMGADGGCLNCHDKKIEIHWLADDPSKPTSFMTSSICAWISSASCR